MTEDTDAEYNGSLWFYTLTPLGEHFLTVLNIYLMCFKKQVKLAAEKAQTPWWGVTVPLQGHLTLTRVQSDFHSLWKRSRPIMCPRAWRVFKQSGNGTVLPVSSCITLPFVGSVFELTVICTLHHQSFTHPLLSHPSSLPFPSLLSSLFPCISRVGCLSVSETKQTQSCVSGLITPRSWETGSSQTSTAVSSFVGHVQHSPDISRRLLGFFCVLVRPCGLWKKGCVEGKQSGTWCFFRYSYEVDGRKRRIRAGRWVRVKEGKCSCVFMKPDTTSASCLVWFLIQIYLSIKRKQHIITASQCFSSESQSWSN